MIESYHEIYGLIILSEIRLPLPPRPPAPADVVVALGATLAGTPAKSSIQGSNGTVVMEVAGVASYRIEAGSRIAVEVASTTDPAELHLFLLGSAFGVLLQQRGILALHANATSDGSRAYAIAGPSGAGKSTLAAMLCASGFRLLSDDVCALASSRNGFTAYPGVARLRLWADACAALGMEPGCGQLVSPRLDKHEFDAADRYENLPRALAAIYILKVAESPLDDGFDTLSGSAAVSALMSNSYRGDLLDFSDGRRRHFEQCIAVASAVPVIEWRRRWGTEHAPENVASLIAHFRQLD